MFQFELDRLEKVSKKIKNRKKAPVCLAENENALKQEYKQLYAMTQSTVDTLCSGKPFSLSSALCDFGKRACCFASHCINIHDSTTAWKIPLSIFVLWKTTLLSYFVYDSIHGYVSNSCRQ